MPPWVLAQRAVCVQNPSGGKEGVGREATSLWCGLGLGFYPPNHIRSCRVRPGSGELPQQVGRNAPVLGCRRRGPGSSVLAQRVVSMCELTENRQLT